MTKLDNLDNAEFLDSKVSLECDALPPPSCDAGPLPPGCDCFCHTACDFGKMGKHSGVRGSGYEPNTADPKIYEMN